MKKPKTTRRKSPKADELTAEQRAAIADITQHMTIGRNHFTTTPEQRAAIAAIADVHLKLVDNQIVPCQCRSDPPTIQQERIILSYFMNPTIDEIYKLHGFFQKRGRKPRYRSAERFREDAIKAHLALVKESRKRDFLKHRPQGAEQYQYSQERIAEKMGFESVEGWRKRAGKLGVDMDELKFDALLAESNLPGENY